MHVEALNWSGLCATHYASAHNLSPDSLRRGDVSVAAVYRTLISRPEMAFRWRVQFGFGERSARNSPRWRLTTGPTGVVSTPVVAHDLLQPPEGMTAVKLADGQQAFAPKGSDPDTVLRHIFKEEAAR
jgi:hypothetical protein